MYPCVPLCTYALCTTHDIGRTQSPSKSSGRLQPRDNAKHRDENYEEKDLKSDFSVVCSSMQLEEKEKVEMILHTLIFILITGYYRKMKLPEQKKRTNKHRKLQENNRDKEQEKRMTNHLTNYIICGKSTKKEVNSSSRHCNFCLRVSGIDFFI